LALIISLTAKSAPISRHSIRYGRSVTPAMGARPSLTRPLSGQNIFRASARFSLKSVIIASSVGAVAMCIFTVGLRHIFSGLGLRRF